MRKLFQIFILILCFIPIFISAGTFEDGKNIANKYMKNNFEEDYSKYIISEDTKYGFSEEGIFSIFGFNKGGLINKYEFDISKTNSDDSSWLYDMNGYWSLTGDNDNAYVIGKSTYPKTNIYNNRIVEYVRNKTRVTGKGTYSNPWVIDKSYQVIIKANREKLINSIYINNNKCGEDRCETNIIMNRDAVFYINFKDGYEYDTSEEGANLCNAAGYSPTLKKLVISNVVNDVECFFKVKEKEYEITFNANGGTLTGKNSKKVTYTKSYGTLPEPTREGYGFAGWYTEQVNGNRIDSSSILDTPEAKTLYAHWNPKSYTVIFDGNNGTPSYSNKTVVYDSKYGTLPTATRTGYTFLGWFTATSGGTQITNDTIVKITDTQTLYAHWKANTYTVRFAKNDGSSNSAGTSTVTYNAKYGSLPTVSRTGYTFVGWFTASSGGKQITKDTTVKITEAQTLYAHWTANKYTVTFIKNDGTSNNAGTSTITFDSSYGTLPTVSRTGYTFVGWFTAASGGTQITKDTIVTTASDHKLYAHWTANKYTVTFDGNGGSVSGNKTKNMTYDANYDLSGVSATRTGYLFLGWYTAASGGTQITKDTKVKMTSAQTLYAHWKLNSYTTSFYVASTLISSKTYTAGDKISYPTKETIANKIYTRKFIGANGLVLDNARRNWYDIVFSNVSFSTTPSVQPENDLNIYITINKNTCYAQFGKGRSGNSSAQLSRLNQKAASNYQFSKYCDNYDGRRTLVCKGPCDEIYGLYTKGWELLISCNDGTSKNGYSTYRAFNIHSSWGMDETRECNNVWN